jgi:hypothetical protein
MEEKSQIEKKRVNNKEINSLNNIIKTLENEINKLIEIIENSKDYNVIDILKILAVSKKNCCSIYYLDNVLKQLVLIEITKQFNKKFEKNFIYNILNKISSDNKETITIELLIFNEKNKSEITNLAEGEINRLVEQGQNYNTNEIYKKTQVNYVKNKLNNNANHVFNNTNEIFEIINKFIDLGIYENIYDFFFSHFVQKRIDLESFLKNLVFTFGKKFNEKNWFDKNEIKNNFINFFQTFTQDELYLLNKAITGTTYRLSSRYIINIIYEDYMDSNAIKDLSDIVYFSTCFNTMNVKYLYFKNNYFNNKELFVKDELKKTQNLLTVV